MGVYIHFQFLIQDHIAGAVRSFATNVQAGPKLLGASVAAIVSAFWYAFTSVLAWVLAGLFFIDLSLGVFRAIHRDGISSFDWSRFGRAWIKMGAAFFGIALFALGDVLFHEFGFPSRWYPLTTVGMMGMCFGFFWSALENFGYFYPNVVSQIERVIEKLSSSDPDKLRRRSTDLPKGEEDANS